MTRVFVSGCYDILHGGHIEFFHQARALGDHLTVCVASDVTVRAYKGREPALPQEHRLALIESLRMVDFAVIGEDCDGISGTPWWADYRKWALALRPSIIAVTEDDEHWQWKQEGGWSVVVLPKQSRYARISTTEIRERIAAK